MDQLYDVRDKMLDVARKYDKYKEAEYSKLANKPKTYAGVALTL